MSQQTQRESFWAFTPSDPNPVHALARWGELKFPGVKLQRTRSGSFRAFIEYLLLCGRVTENTAFCRAGRKHVFLSITIPTAASEQSGGVRISGSHSQGCLCSLALCPRPPMDAPLNNARPSTAFFLPFILMIYIYIFLPSFVCTKSFSLKAKTESLQHR